MTPKKRTAATLTGATAKDPLVFDLMAQCNRARDALGDPGDAVSPNARRRLLQTRDHFATIRNVLGVTWAYHKRKKSALQSVRGRLGEATRNLTLAQAAVERDVASGRLAPAERRATTLFRSYSEDVLLSCELEVQRLQTPAQTLTAELATSAARLDVALRDVEAALSDAVTTPSPTHHAEAV